MRHTLGEAGVLVAVVWRWARSSGCTSYTGSKANQVRQWASIALVTSNDNLVVPGHRGHQDARCGPRRSMDVTSNCSGLVFDTGTAYGNLPTPDNTLTNELNVAYEDFASAGSSCAAARSLHSRRITGRVGDDRRGCRLARQGDPPPGRRRGALSVHVAAGRAPRAQRFGASSRASARSPRPARLRFDREHPRRSRSVLSPMASTRTEYDRLRRRVLWKLPTGLYLLGSRAGRAPQPDDLELGNAGVLDPKYVAVSVEQLRGDPRPDRRRGLLFCRARRP